MRDRWHSPGPPREVPAGGSSKAPSLPPRSLRLTSGRRPSRFDHPQSHRRRTYRSRRAVKVPATASTNWSTSSIGSLDRRGEPRQSHRHAAACRPPVAPPRSLQHFRPGTECDTVETEVSAGGAVRRTSARQVVRRGAFPNGMEFLTWGAGSRKLLFIHGGPGSELPKGLAGRMLRRWFGPFVKAGFTIWYVTRRRNMPRGHTVADMADDYADVITNQLDGRIDLLVGSLWRPDRRVPRGFSRRSVGSGRHRGRGCRGE